MQAGRWPSTPLTSPSFSSNPRRHSQDTPPTAVALSPHDSHVSEGGTVLIVPESEHAEHLERPAAEREPTGQGSPVRPFVSDSEY